LIIKCNSNSNSNEYGACDYRFNINDGQVFFARNNLVVLSSPPNHGPFDMPVRTSLDHVDDDGYELKLNFKKH
jgi:hypothetical protein